MASEALAVWCCSQCGAIYHKDFPRCPNDGAEVVLAMRDPLLDATIDRYVIQELLGEGGMGRVYSARHATLPGKRYAVKVLLGDLAATGTMRKRFSQEAESASRLAHPNLVNVIDFGCMASGLPYIVMDFVDGRPLTNLISGPMDPARAIRICRAVCEGLAHAHAAGVVHRDLKPDNIMVVIGPNGEEIPRVADFGLAVTEDPKEARLTSTGMAMGTPAYSAPEQMAGKRVDHRADLYALGMTMFEMLTGGKMPFDGSPLEVMTAKAHKESPLISEISPGLPIPPALEVVVAKLLRRWAIERYASAREVIAALDDVVLGMAADDRASTVADPSRPVSAVSTGASSLRRTRRRLAAALGIVVAGLGTGIGFARLTHDGPRTPAPRVVQPELAPAAVASAVPDPQPAPAPVVAAAPTAPIDIELDDPPAKDLPKGKHPVKHPAHAGSRPPATHKVAHTGPARTHDATVSKDPPIETLKVETLKVETPKVVEVPAPPPVPVPVPPPVVVRLDPRVVGVDVSGSLSEAIVKRAVDRVGPALRPCTATAEQNVQIQFTIDESRRAQNVHGSGAPQATLNCLVTAFNGVRSEAAPDTGDVEVRVHIAFKTKL